MVSVSWSELLVLVVFDRLVRRAWKIGCQLFVLSVGNWYLHYALSFVFQFFLDVTVICLCLALLSLEEKPSVSVTAHLKVTILASHLVSV